MARIGNRLAEILDELSPEQLRWLIARMDCNDAKSACARADVAYRTWSRWPRELLDEAVALMAQDGLVTALHLRRRALAKAMQIKVAGLDSRDRRMQQQVATEIIEWELGRAAQAVDVTSGGQALGDLLASVRSALNNGDAEGAEGAGGGH
jgi:hypothetical protein